MGKA
jgi:hypothetical protein